MRERGRGHIVTLDRSPTASRFRRTARTRRASSACAACTRCCAPSCAAAACARRWFRPVRSTPRSGTRSIPTTARASRRARRCSRADAVAERGRVRRHAAGRRQRRRAAVCRGLEPTADPCSFRSSIRCAVRNRTTKRGSSRRSNAPRSATSTKALLGCPSCLRRVSDSSTVSCVRRRATPAPSSRPTRREATRLAAALDLTDPRMTALLHRRVGRACAADSRSMSPAQLLLVNPPDGIVSGDGVSIVLANTAPLATASMDAVAVDALVSDAVVARLRATACAAVVECSDRSPVRYHFPDRARARRRGVGRELERRSPLRVHRFFRPRRRLRTASR